MADAGPPTGSEVWAEEFDSMGGDVPSPTGIALDKQGNAYVIGYLSGNNITFSAADGGSLTGDCAYYLASFDKTGAYRWGTTFEAIGDSCTAPDDSSVAVDSNGNVFFAGQVTQASVQVGPTTYPTPGGGILLVSFTSAGVLRWVNAMGSGYPTAMAVDHNDNLFLTGVGGNGLGTSTLSAAGMFFAKIDPTTGMADWAVGYGDVATHTPGTQVPAGMAIDSANDVLITGGFSNSIQLDTVSLVATGTNDIFLAKFYTGAMFVPTIVWGKSFGSMNAADYGDAVAVDSSDAVLFVGWLGGTTNLGNGAMPVAPLTDFYDGFVAKYDTSGTFDWALTFGGTLGVSSPSQVISNKNNDIIIAGAGAGTFNFGGGAPLMAPGMAPNVFLTKFDTTGKYDWAKLFGDTNGQQFPVVATNPTTQEIVVAFANQGTVDLGANQLTVSPGGLGLVIARFNP